MNPAKGDEIVGVLEVKQVLLVLSVTAVRRPCLLWHQHVCDEETPTLLKYMCMMKKHPCS